MTAMPPTSALPLDGIRVLEYAQYVAGPFAGMLLADLGADVIKVEPPAGDAWRRYEPFAEGESRYFYALNRNKRSVVIDLKDPEGRAASAALIRTADVVLHNLPPHRARRFGLDRDQVREVNPGAVWCCVSALGSDGPEAALPAFDLVAQALSGLLLANAHDSDPVPQRAGGIAMADFTAGLLAAIAALAGLAGRRPEGAHGVEVSLLGAALAVQTQRFVSVETLDRTSREERTAAPKSADDLRRLARPTGHTTSSSRTTAHTPPLMASSSSPACMRASAGPPPPCSDFRIPGRPTRRLLRLTPPSASDGSPWWRSSSAVRRPSPRPGG